MARKRTPLEPLARRLRSQQTDAETRLWHHLRARRLSGYKFRRQLPIGKYIADFVCIEQALIVELDGGQHAISAKYDQERSQTLLKRGFRVLRFWNDVVLNETEAVLETILLALADPSPQPSPLERGEGAR